MENKSRKKSRFQISNCNAVPKRFVVAFLSLWGLLLAFCMRINISVAIIAMVSQTNISHGSNLTSEVTLSKIPTEASTEKPLQGEHFNWDRTQQGLVLSAFHWGYFISMLPGGYLATKFGAVRIYGLCLISTSVFTLLTPVFASWGLVPFLVLRSLMGFGEGPMYPSVMAILGLWSPQMELSRMTSITMVGAAVGNVLSLFLSGILCSSDFLGGWPAAFYVFGFIGCVWYLFWIIFVYENPQKHPNISQKELLKFKNCGSTTNKKHKVPWKSISTSVPFYALVAGNVGIAFGYNIFVTEIPTYLNTVLNFNVKESGFISTLPFFSHTAGTIISAFIADKLRASGKCGITVIRKTFHSIAGFGPGICLFLITFSGRTSILIVSFLCLGMFLNGFKFSGFIAATVDMSPDFAGVMFGFTNGIGSLTAMTAPLITGVIIDEGATIENWSKVFYITAGIYFGGATLFDIFGTAELQPWGKAEKETTDEEKS